jgi:pyruvate kinase
VDYAGLPGDVGAGDTLLLNDGLIRLVVTDVTGPRVTTVVRAGGWLGSHKGINKAHGGLTAPALTDKDIADIETVAEMKADYVAVSFPKNGSDMLLAARLVREAVERHHPVAAAAAAASPNAPSSASSRVHKVRTVAKVERCEAIECLDEIIHASDAVMVARGDLGVEVGQASVPGIQKRMVRLARQLGKPVIVATQMMESMITNPVPTRAEVSDVANAVLDGTDCVMLSAESASGKYPVESVEWLHRICLEAEHSRHDDNESGGGTGIQVNGGGSSSGRSSGHGGHFPASAAQLLHRGPVPVSGVLTTMPHAHASDADNTSQEQQQQQQQQQQPRLANIDEGLAIGALFAAAHTGCRVLACVTETGETALRMSRCTHDLPVIAVTNRLSTARRTAMFAGVSTLVLDTLTDSEAVFTDVRRELLRLGFVKAGDRIGLTFGNPVGIAGGTNALMIRTV